MSIDFSMPSLDADALKMVKAVVDDIKDMCESTCGPQRRPYTTLQLNIFSPAKKRLQLKERQIN